MISESLRKFICDGTPARICERYAQLPELAKTTDFGPFSSNVVVIDTETTGLSFNHDELTQIAAARMEGGKIVDWYVTFVNPGRTISDEIVHLTHITQDDVASAPTPNEALQGLVEFVGDAICVAHNVEFDRTFTTKHPAGYPLLENIWVDSLDLARIALPRLKSHRLLDLVRAFEAPLSTHRADADVEATCAILPILLAGVSCMPPALVYEIAQFATPAEWSTQVVFAYFDQVNAEKEAESAERELLEPTDTSDKNKILKEDARGDFSLLRMRKRNLGTLNARTKLDADVLAAEGGPGMSAPTREEIRAAFEPEGLIGSLFEDFEQRSEQVEMACAVRDAYDRSENLVVEAGTGVGKSMAYLLPSALLAKQNGVSVGIATKTNTLLDQLIYHELPALHQAFINAGMQGLTYAPLKGFSHYPCLRKVEQVMQSGNFMHPLGDKEQSCAVSLAALLSYIEQTDYDDMDALKIDYRLLPRWSITSSSQECLRRKCRFCGNSCFVHGSRKAAESADIVVTNHSLLFCDLAADGGLLPTIRHWVIDEAHGAEEEARRAFSCKISSEDILRIATRVSAPESSKNSFVRAERLVSAEVPDSEDQLLRALTGKALAAGRAFDEAAHAYVPTVKNLLFFDANRNKNYEYVELWVNEEIRKGDRFAEISQAAQLLSTTAEKLIAASQEIVAYLDQYTVAATVQREIAITVLSCKELIEACDIFFKDASDIYAYSATLSHKKDRYVDVLEALPVNMGSTLEEALYERTHSVVYASATLAVGESFSAIENALGLNMSEASHAQTLQLASSFDFDTNMTIYVPSDLPEPNDRSYLSALQDLLVKLHIAQNGSLLTLFTNRRELEACFEEVYPQLKAEDLRLVCQKKGVSVKGLRDEFLSDEHLSLFALKSFWEGFDAPGSTLRGVVIPKLPFAKPTDPLSCERAQRDSEAWRHYVLPAAVIDMKQAAGRLIRTHTDSGILVLADHRLISKGYGRTFLNSMPSKNIKIMSCAEIVDDVAQHNQ